MEQKFNNNRLDLQVLRKFCEREGEDIAYRKGDQLEREGDPARWFAFVTEGCFKYVKYGKSDDKAHITWFSFEGEFVCDYPVEYIVVINWLDANLNTGFSSSVKPSGSCPFTTIHPFQKSSVSLCSMM